MDHLFVGQFVHSKSFDELELIIDAFMAVCGGKIVKIGKRSELAQWQTENPVFTNVTATELSAGQFLMPGFIDCHIHAPQMPNAGLGLDMELMDWLNTYTFPLEAKYADTEFAKRVYEKVVKRTLSYGTTLATYFATNHRQSTLVLAKEALRQGQRAFVGKVSSNCCSPDYYIEKTDESIQENHSFVKDMLALKTNLVRPIVTPRFAASCDMQLLKELATLANDNGLNIQSHISESLAEIQLVRDTFGMGYAATYDAAGLLTERTVMAHGVHLDDDELTLFAKRQTSIAHCPTSNTNLRSGLFDVKRARAFGVTVGLGTDVSGGHSPSVLNALKDALGVSHHLNFVKNRLIMGTGRMDYAGPAYSPMTMSEAIYLATLGGAEAMAVSDVVGNFVVGKEFDALIIDVMAADPIDWYDGAVAQPDLMTLLQKFIYLGDDRNVAKVFVAGRQVKE